MNIKIQCYYGLTSELCATKTLTRYLWSNRNCFKESSTRCFRISIPDHDEANEDSNQSNKSDCTQHDNDCHVGGLWIRRIDVLSQVRRRNICSIPSEVERKLYTHNELLYPSHCIDRQILLTSSTLRCRILDICIEDRRVGLALGNIPTLRNLICCDQHRWNHWMDCDTSLNRDIQCHCQVYRIPSQCLRWILL